MSDLIGNAVAFLQDPSVQSSPLASRIAFLEKKGLSQGDIDEALRRAGLDRPEAPMKQVAAQLNVGPPERMLRMAQNNSGLTWYRLATLVVITSGTIVAALNKTALLTWFRYAVKRTLRYIKTLIYGDQEDESLSSIPSPYFNSIPIDRLSDLKKELADLRSDVQQINTRLEDTIKEEVEQVRNSVRFTCGKLEDEIEDLRTTIIA